MKQYKVLMGTFANFVEDKMNDAAKEGYEFDAVTVGQGATVVVMSKEVRTPIAGVQWEAKLVAAGERK